MTKLIVVPFKVISFGALIGLLLVIEVASDIVFFLALWSKPDPSDF